MDILDTLQMFKFMSPISYYDKKKERNEGNLNCDTVEGS